MWINVNNIRGRMKAFYDYFVKSDRDMNEINCEDTFDESSSKEDS